MNLLEANPESALVTLSKLKSMTQSDILSPKSDTTTPPILNSTKGYKGWCSVKSTSSFKFNVIFLPEPDVYPSPFLRVLPFILITSYNLLLLSIAFSTLPTTFSATLELVVLELSVLRELVFLPDLDFSSTLLPYCLVLIDS